MIFISHPRSEKFTLKVDTISFTNTHFLNFSLTIILIRRIVAETISMWILQLFPQRQVQLRRHPGTRQYDQRTQVDPLLSLLSPALWLVRTPNFFFRAVFTFLASCGSLLRNPQTFREQLVGSISMKNPNRPNSFVRSVDFYCVV